jgi:hypothetical protein
MYTGVTHFHVNIGCHVNLISLTTPFATQNKSRHFDLRDSSMSRVTPFDLTHFESKSVLFFLSFTIFI